MIFGRTRDKADWTVVDIHCHILPGLDDGARDLAEAVDMLRQAAAEGISDMVMTPHFHSGRYMASPEEVLKKLKRIRKAIKDGNIPVRVYPGNEVYYFDGMADCLRQHRLCTMNGSKHVLVEFSPYAMFLDMQNAMDRLLSGGWQPVLAHAERYECLLKNADGAGFLHDMGVQIQVNASSVTGKGGKEGKRFVHRLLEGRLADYIGTDAHRSDRRTPQIARCREIVIKKYGADYAYRIMRGNAGEMLGL